MDNLKILSYGVSMTTLEEVFIKANETHREEGGEEGPQKRPSLMLNDAETERAKGGSKVGQEWNETEPGYMEEENLVN